MNDIPDHPDRDRIEKVFHECEDMFHSMFGKMQEGFAYCQVLFKGTKPADFRYLSVNAAFEHLTGLGDLGGKKTREILSDPEMFSAELFEGYKKAHESGQATRCEIPSYSVGKWLSLTVYDQQNDRFLALVIDITERIIAEENNRLFRTLLDHSSNAIEVIDPETGRILDCNERAYRDLGYSREELLKLSVFDIDPMVNALSFGQFRHKLRTSGAATWEGVHRRKDGSMFPVEVNLSYVELNQDYQVAVIHDITDRQRIEKELNDRIKLARFQASIGESLVRPEKLEVMLQQCTQALVDNFGAAFARIWTLNESEQVLELQASAGLYTHKDGPHSRVPLGPFKISVIARERKPHLTNQIIDDPQISDQEWAARERMVAFAGYPLMVEDHVVGVMAMFSREPLSEQHLQAMGTVATSVAVAIERKRVEAAQKLKSAALNAAFNIIIITDRSGAIEWVNNAFTQFLGYSSEEAIGKNPRDLLKLDLPDRTTYKSMWKTLLSGKVWQAEVPTRCKDGRMIPMEMTITPVKDILGTITHYIAIGRDLSEHKQLQAQFLQSQKMESVGRLAGGIAHDFNNLLSVIIGHAEFISMQLGEEDPRRSDVNQILLAGNRAASLTRQLLIFSRKQTVKLSIVNLNTIIENMGNMLRRLIGEDIELIFIPGTNLGNVSADPGQVEQVIMNLAVNSRDAMPGGGRLIVETRNIDLDEAYTAAHRSVSPGPHVLLAISDTGIGMDEETQAQIFEPFFTTKEPGIGTGLGMSTVYGIVNQWRGSIWIYSEPGRGTTFKIYMPLKDSQHLLDVPIRDIVESRGTETILVVEDEEALRLLVERTLKSVGYTVLSASNGEEALLLLERHDERIDLLLTDVIMPGINGHELATQLSLIRPSIKLLFMSGYTDSVISHTGMLKNNTNFIEKPYSLSSLKRKVRDVLDSHDDRSGSDKPESPQ